MTGPVVPWLVDAERLFVELLSDRLAPANVCSQADANIVDLIPVVILSLSNGRRIANGSPQLGQMWDLGVTILAAGKSGAFDLNALTYYHLHTLQDSGSSVAGVGGVAKVDDVDIPHRVATSILANAITQYSGSFAVAVQPIS